VETIGGVRWCSPHPLQVQRAPRALRNVETPAIAAGNQRRFKHRFIVLRTIRAGTSPAPYIIHAEFGRLLTFVCELMA